MVCRRVALGCPGKETSGYCTRLKLTGKTRTTETLRHSMNNDSNSTKTFLTFEEDGSHLKIGVDLILDVLAVLLIEGLDKS